MEKKKNAHEARDASSRTPVVVPFRVVRHDISVKTYLVLEIRCDASQASNVALWRMATGPGLLYFC